MEQQILKIKCPFCGAVLSVRPQPGLESKNVTCPICKQKSPFVKFRRVVVSPQAGRSLGDDETCTTYRENASTDGQPKSVTETNEGMQIGTLNQLGAIPVTYTLKVGRNIIGRRAVGSIADIQIPNEISKRLSREHVVIDVKNIPGKGVVHYASLYKEKVNATFVNNERLEYGDCVILHPGDVLKLPDVNLKFDLPKVLPEKAEKES